MRRGLALVAAVIALAGCEADPVAPPSETPSVQASAPRTPGPTTPAFTVDFPAIDGSTGLIPLGSLLLQRFASVPKKQADNLAFTAAPSAYETLACGELRKSGAILLAYEPAQDTLDSIAECERLEYHPIGRDALVFLVNAANPVASLTTKQYQDLYSGKTANWQALGGPDQPVTAFQRPESSSSQALMRKAVMGKTALAEAPDAYVKDGVAGDLVPGVANYDNSAGAIGYSMFYYAQQMYASSGVKMLAANGVAPSKQTIADGTYPYLADFYVVIRANEPKDGPARQVVAWLESETGQQAVVDAGYVGKK